MSYSVDLVAAFVGLTFVPHPIVIGSNNLNPILTLHNNDVEYRSLFVKGRMEYDRIDQVGLFRAWSTNNIIITPKGSLFTHCFNVRSEQQLTEVLKILQQKGCKLSTKANTYLNEQIV